MGIGSIADSGMQAAMTNMEVISNNIANANTYGFKKSRLNFADIYPGGSGSAGAQAGLGVNVSSINQSFTSGSYDSTGSGTDLAIKNNGFFILKNAQSGQTSYSRNGHFTKDTSGYLMFEDGISRLQGFPAASGQILAGASVTDIQVSQSAMAAKASTTIAEKINLDSSSAVLNPASFNASDPTTYTYSTTAPNVYDTLGNKHPVTLYFIKTAQNQYSIEAAVDGTVLSPSIAATATFSSSGALLSTTNLSAISFPVTTGATTPQSISVDLTGSTQYGNPSSAVSIQPDGYPAGNFDDVLIDGDGNVFAQYTNGQKSLVGQIALADFQSPEGLSPIGNMSWIESTESGQPIISQSLSSANFFGGKLETSNVDLSTEMINLISAQHTFQANAQVAKTYDEVMQTVIQL